jgi:pilus assembly protein Flp/PilA
MNASAKKRKAGQGMTEYIIILAIIAIGAILIIGIFGKQIKATFGKSTAAMQGKSKDDAKIEDATVTSDSMKQNDMGTFDKNVSADK